MLGKINLAIEETNAAFLLSGVKMRMQLVHAHLHPTHQESGLKRALKHLTNGHDEILDNVYVTRTKCGAHAASL